MKANNFILVFSNCAIFFYTSYGIFHEFCKKLRFEVSNYYAKSQNIRSIGLNALFTVNSLDIFLHYIFEFVFNMAPSALSSVCRQKCYGKGFKSRMIILSSVVVRTGRTEQDIWCLIPL